MPLPRSVALARLLAYAEVGVCGGTIAWAAALVVSGDFATASTGVRDDDVSVACVVAVVAAVVAIRLLVDTPRAARGDAASARSVVFLQAWFVTAVFPPRVVPLVAVWLPLAAATVVALSRRDVAAYLAAADARLQSPPPRPWWVHLSPAVADEAAANLAAALVGVAVSFLSGALVAGIVNGNFSGSGAPRGFSTAAAVAGCVTFALLVVVTAELTVVRRFSGSAKVTQMPVYSPDGQHVWDGFAWRPATLTRAAVAYSPDGRFWWDGQAWQPVGPQ